MNSTSIEKQYYSKGKLLLSGEYAVLDGAVALAVPTKLGQRLNVKNIEYSSSKLFWKSLNHKGDNWFEAVFELPSFQVEETTDKLVSETLSQIFKEISAQNNTSFKSNSSYECVSILEFPNDYGLGSSSTLLYNLAQWSKTNPYNLLQKTFGGSGYDIACANAESEILYQWIHNQPQITPVSLPKNITEQLAFVHLNMKQNSREGIQLYKTLPKNETLIEKISEITYSLLESQSIENFSEAMNEHEAILANFLKIPTVKQRFFRDYKGSIKSLGAWGGDFIMIEKKPDFTSYFQNKGFHTIFNYSELI